MEMGDKTRTHCYKTAKKFQRIFLQNKFFFCTVIHYIGADTNSKAKHNSFTD